MQRILLFVLALTMSLPAQAQLGAPVKNGETSIIVTGTRPRDSKVPMSDWRMAETPHVVVFAQGDEKALRRTAENLETLHFLLSALFGRVDAPDETIKVAVTMIGDVATFEQLRLTDLRWQYGPFPEAFAKSIYYDPRDEGSVLASTEDGVNLILQPSRGRPTNRNCTGGDNGPALDNFIVVRPDPAGLANGSLSPDVFDIIQQLPMNEIAVCQSAESRLYAGFAQNYLMTYFPAAYPRWFLQGFGEMFATMAAGDDFVEYGQLPTGFTKVMDFYGDYPVSHILDGRYLTSKRAWTPYHAWRIVHFLYFSEEWKPRLQAYLAALARGDDLASAAQALGNPVELQRAVARYRGRKVQGERMTFPAERAAEASIRRLTRAEAGLIRGRLELGARIEVPADDGRDRTKALARRADWIARLRDNATRFPDLIEHQLLLAEAECRAGNSAECLAAADRALAQLPADTRALVWKGTATTQLAARTPGAEGRRQAAAGRRLIVRANRLDPESSLPLIAYHDSFAAVGEPASDAAVEGLIKVVGASPAAPTTRLKLGEELVRRELEFEARKTLLPVAKGPFESPEQPAAAALLPKPGAAGGG
ncbi:hypothetical protein ACX40Y_06980 [Sphingomonas sp. RS6]